MILECYEELRDHPQVLEIEAALRDESSSGFAERAPLFERILASTLPLVAVKAALARMAADPDYQLQHFVMEEVLKGWTFLLTTQFALSIGVRGRPCESVRAVPEAANTHGPRLQPYPFDLFIGCLGGDPFEMQCYTVGARTDPESPPTLHWQWERRITPGASAMLRAGMDMVTSQLNGPLVYLEIAAPATSRILPRFNQQTLEFTGWVSGDATASRLELLTRTLAEFDHKPAAARLAALTAHEDHYVRWNSMRHLLRLDAELGIQQLRRAGSDSNAEIRQLSASALHQIGA